MANTLSRRVLSGIIHSVWPALCSKEIMAEVKHDVTSGEPVIFGQHQWCPESAMYIYDPNKDMKDAPVGPEKKDIKAYIRKAEEPFIKDTSHRRQSDVNFDQLM